MNPVHVTEKVVNRLRGQFEAAEVVLTPVGAELLLRGAPVSTLDRTIIVQPLRVETLSQNADGSPQMVAYGFAITNALVVTKSNMERQVMVSMEKSMEVLRSLVRNRQTGEPAWWVECGFINVRPVQMSNISDNVSNDYVAWEMAIAVDGYYSP